MSRMGRIKLMNFVLFQAGWFACVLGAANGYPWVGPLAAGAALLAHFRWADRPRVEARLLAICVLAGLLFDALLLATGWVGFPSGQWLPGLAPYWMACMWLLFGTTLNLSMAWMHKRYSLAALFGAIGGPLAYLAGERLGGIMLTQQLPALIALAVGWGAITPLLVHMASKLNGFRHKPLPDYVLTGIGRQGASHHA